MVIENSFSPRFVDRGVENKNTEAIRKVFERLMENWDLEIRSGNITERRGLDYITHELENISPEQRKEELNRVGMPTPPEIIEKIAEIVGKQRPNLRSGVFELREGGKIFELTIAIDEEGIKFSLLEKSNGDKTSLFVNGFLFSPSAERPPEFLITFIPPPEEAPENFVGANAYWIGKKMDAK